MIALLVGIVRAHEPVVIESVLNAGSHVDRIRGFVARVNEVAGTRRASGQAACADECISANTTRKAAWACGSVRAIDPLECGGPPILRQIVVKHAESGTEDGLLAPTG